MAYDDGRVACTEEALVIRAYYFPPHDKHIPYGRIEQVRQEPMSGMGGQYRLWGSGDFVHPDTVAAELAAHGVNVTNG